VSIFKIFYAILIVLFCIGCASNINTIFCKIYGVNKNPTWMGGIVFKLSEPVKKLNITIDDYMVVENVFTDNIEIKNIPMGNRKFKIVSKSYNNIDGLNKDTLINIEPEVIKTFLIQVAHRK
jgi:hypothetical protein